MSYFVLKCEIKIGKRARNLAFNGDDALSIDDVLLANAPVDVPTEPDEEDA